MSQIHGFAAQSGGRAEIESRPGEGSTIRIFLPRSTKKAASVPDEAVPAPSLTGLNVLLVEDNPHVLVFAEHLLAELQYKVVTAKSGAEALEALENHDVDLLLTDVVMPGMSGVELAQKVRERDPMMPVVLASGYSEEILQGSGAEFEMLRKPFDSTSVMSAITAAVRQIEARGNSSARPASDLSPPVASD